METKFLLVAILAIFIGCISESKAQCAVPNNIKLTGQQGSGNSMYAYVGDTVTCSTVGDNPSASHFDIRLTGLTGTIRNSSANATVVFQNPPGSGTLRCTVSIPPAVCPEVYMDFSLTVNAASTTVRNGVDSQLHVLPSLVFATVLTGLKFAMG